MPPAATPRRLKPTRTIARPTTTWVLSLERQGKFAEALEAFEKSLAIEPKRWQAQVGRGLSLLQLGKNDRRTGGV